MKYFSILVIIFSCQTMWAQEKHMHKHQADNEPLMKIYPVLFQQTSAEYRALCYQAFNIAKASLDQILTNYKGKQKPAIVTDLDETIIDNSYIEASLIKAGRTYGPGDWKKWVDMAAATAVPGAIDFLKYAKSKGVTIFYISNRDTGAVNATLKNLIKLDIPDAKRENLLFMAGVSSKESRREKVESEYDIIMLLGDNLNDFTTEFEKRPISDRFLETDKAREQWGTRFIVLPNATYGEWESAVIDYKKGLTPMQKDSLRRDKLITPCCIKD